MRRKKMSADHQEYSMSIVKLAITKKLSISYFKTLNGRKISSIFKFNEVYTIYWFGNYLTSCNFFNVGQFMAYFLLLIVFPSHLQNQETTTTLDKDIEAPTGLFIRLKEVLTITQKSGVSLRS